MQRLTKTLVKEVWVRQCSTRQVANENLKEHVGVWVEDRRLGQEASPNPKLPLIDRDGSVKQ